MFAEKETRILFTLLAAILHLGNLSFQGEVQIIKKVSHTTCHTAELKQSQRLISRRNFIVIITVVIIVLVGIIIKICDVYGICFLSSKL